MNRSILLLTIIGLTGVLSSSLVSCEVNTTDSARGDSITIKEPDNNSDLPLFELTGKVKQCRRTTYYHVNISPEGKAVVDTAGGSKTVTMVFDRRNHYVPKENEKIQRDTLGRVTKWEDNTPNRKGLHGGFLMDVLTYDYSNPHVMITEGMGELTTTTRDDNGNILAQISMPLGTGTTTSVANVVLESDDKGNWTRRLSVWTDRETGQKPRVYYMLDTREIIYF